MHTIVANSITIGVYSDAHNAHNNSDHCCVIIVCGLSFASFSPYPIRSNIPTKHLKA